MSRAVLLVLALLLPSAAAAACGPFDAPVLDLDFASRYADDDPSRSEIDPEREAAAKAAIGPLDDFVSKMTSATDTALEADDREAAACVMAELAHWARADALSDLGSVTVELTIASRLAALAIVAGQVAGAAAPRDFSLVRSWLTRRMEEQMTFWETAPDGAAQGNLRSWGALAGAAVALISDDAVIRGWSAWSLTYVACTANPDGSLPQEMSRRELALHYQLHAVAPLTVAASLLARQGMILTDRCDRALDRIVRFSIDDLVAGGVASEAITGVPQTLDSGIGDISDFQLSWAEAWLSLRADPGLEALIAARRPLGYSKLGGDQTRIWQGALR